MTSYKQRYEQMLKLIRRVNRAYYKEAYEDGEILADVLSDSLSFVSYEDLEEEIFPEPVISIQITHIYPSNNIAFSVTVSDSRSYFVQSKEIARDIIRRLATGSVKLEPKGHPFYDFLK